MENVTSLPNYLQKQIITLIVKESNKLNKNVTIPTIYNQFIITLSQVCWSWFNCVSNQINICHYNNYNINKYNLIKNQNLKYFIVKLPNSNKLIKELVNNKLNQVITNMDNLKKLIILNNEENEIIIDNFGNINSTSFIFDIKLPNIGSCKISILNTTFKKFTSFSNNITSTSILSSSNINHIINLKFVYPYFINTLQEYEEESGNVIKLFKDIKIDYISNQGPNYSQDFQNSFKLRDLSPPLKLIFNSNLKELLIGVKGYFNHNIPVSIDQLYYLLKLSPNLESLLISLCYDDLIYKLSKSQKSVIIEPCRYCGGDVYNVQEFYNQWEFISNSIKDHKHLKYLSISNGCQYDPNKTIGSYQQYQFPNEFISNIGEIILNNKSINTFVFDDFHTPQLLEFIYNSNNTNNTINSLFSSIRITDINNNYNEYKSKLNEIIKNNQQIEKLNIDKIDDMGVSTEIIAFSK